MKDFVEIATLITCHNRKEKTLQTLEILHSQVLKPNCQNHIYVNDDGSSDGTYENIRDIFPDVELIKSDGTRFWCRGMYDVFSIAMEKNYDFYFWINDDTFLNNTALQFLLDTYKQIFINTGTPTHIIVGTTVDPISKKISFGGVRRTSLWHPLRFSLIEPEEKPVQVDTMNGNCVLIPKAIVEEIGLLDPTFVHYKGDMDYGLRARKAEGTIWVAPGIIGTCKRDNFPGKIDFAKYQSQNILEIIQDPKSNLNPRETFTYVKRHGGPFWFLFWPIKYIAFFSRYCFFRFFHAD